MSHIDANSQQNGTEIYHNMTHRVFCPLPARPASRASGIHATWRVLAVLAVGALAVSGAIMARNTGAIRVLLSGGTPSAVIDR